MILAIYGAGGMGREVLEFARSICRWREILFVDDVTDLAHVRNARVLRFPEVAELQDTVEFTIANGEPAARKALYEKVKAAGYQIATLISQYVVIAPGVQIGEGAILYDGVLSVDTVVGINAVMCAHTVLGHDAHLGAHSYMSHNCFVGGGTHIGECVYMGPGSMARERITVGDNAIISLGAILHRDVHPEAIMVGNPARQIGENKEHKVFGMFDE